MSNFGEILNRVDGAQNIGNVHERNQLGPQLADRSLGVFQVPRGGDWNKLQIELLALGQKLPGDQIAVMFHQSKKDRIPLLEKLLSPGVSHQIDRLGCSAGEDDLGRISGPNELGQLAPRTFVSARGFFRQQMNSSMDIRVVPL